MKTTHRENSSFDELMLGATSKMAEGQASEAEALLRRAVAIEPTNATAAYRLGVILFNSDRLAEAKACFDVTIEHAPHLIEGWLARASIERRNEEYESAAYFGKRAWEIDPFSASTFVPLVEALQLAGRPTDALSLARRLPPSSLSSDPLITASLLFPMMYSPHSAQELFDAHVRFGVQTAATVASIPTSLPSDFPAPAEPERRLRVGYFQPEFFSRWAPRFILPWLRLHDRQEFEVYAYGCSHRADELQRASELPVAQYRNVADLDDDEFAQQIFDDRIDVFVDLAGLTSSGRFVTLCRSPAPVVVHYLGYPNTTGLPGVDWRMVDSTTDPSGTECFATERLWRLDPCFLCFQFPDEMPDVSSPPSTQGAPFTFGSFNTLAKMDRHVLEVWARLLREVPQSRLLLKNSGLEKISHRQRVLSDFERFGIAPERIELMGELPSQIDHWSLYHRMDVALDTFPYNGTTTTADALWMGVPIVTLEGQSHVSRVGASMLRTAGFGEWIARETDQYLSIAKRLANSRTRLVEYRRRQRQQVAASPLCDAPAFVRRFEHALRGMWRDWCETAAMKK